MTQLETKPARFETAERLSERPPHGGLRVVSGVGTAIRAMDLDFELHRGEPGGLLLAADLRRDLLDLDASATSGTLFQSLGWIEAWVRTAGAAAREHPVLAVGRDKDGTPRAMLPLAVACRYGCRVMTWLGATHIGYGEPVLAPGLPAESRAVAMLAHDVARACDVDVLSLTGLPVAPLVTVMGGTLRDANDSFVLPLTSDFEAQYRQLFSAKTRSQLRRKWRRLEAIGHVAVVEAETAPERLLLLDTFFAQKASQLALTGAPNVFSQPAISAFYRALATADDRRLHLSALSVAGRTAAIVMAMRHRDRIYMLNTSIAADRDLAEASPGKLLLHEHVRASHAAGARIYDFGPGEAGYKREWHTTAVPLMIEIRSLSPRGRVAAAILTASAVGKRTIKRSPALWQLARSARRTLRLHRPGPATQNDTAGPPLER